MFPSEYSTSLMGIPEFLDYGRTCWTLDSTLWTLGSGQWILSLFFSEQNQNQFLIPPDSIIETSLGANLYKELKVTLVL